MKFLKKLFAISLAISLLAALSACQRDNGKIDQSYADEIIGEYQVNAEEVDGDEYVGTWWHLTIEKGQNGLLGLSIYDNEAGNPGIEGIVESLDEENIVLKYNPDLYEELPSALWKLDGKYLKMTYKVTDIGIELTNNEKTLTFHEVFELITYSAQFNAPDSHKIEDMEITENDIKIGGWIYTEKGGWEERNYTFELSPDCLYDDCLENNGYLSKEDFQALIAKQASKHVAFEIDARSNEAMELRLINIADSAINY